MSDKTKKKRYLDKITEGDRFVEIPVVVFSGVARFCLPLQLCCVI